jgi:hypothetical protein
VSLTLSAFIKAAAAKIGKPHLAEEIKYNIRIATNIFYFSFLIYKLSTSNQQRSSTRYDLCPNFQTPMQYNYSVTFPDNQIDWDLTKSNNDTFSSANISLL